MPLTQFKGKKSKHTKKTPKKKKTRRKLKQRKLQKSAVIRSGQLIRKALLEELGRPPALQEVQQVHELIDHSLLLCTQLAAESSALVIPSLAAFAERLHFIGLAAKQYCSIHQILATAVPSLHLPPTQRYSPP